MMSNRSGTCRRRHNVVGMMLIAAVMLGSMMMESQSHGRPLVQDEQHRDSSSLLLELSSRDDMVQMAGYGEEKLSTVLITGMLLCNNNNPRPPYCLNQLIPPQPISGALVAATCKTKNTDKKRQMRGAKAVSDKHGEFTIDLPSELHAIHNLDKACSVKVLHLPKNSSCRQSAFARKHNKISLSSVENGVRTYGAGAITFHGTIPKHSKACIKTMDDDQEKSS